jgi:hypothetical protein
MAGALRAILDAPHRMPSQIPAAIGTRSAVSSSRHGWSAAALLPDGRGPGSSPYASLPAPEDAHAGVAIDSRPFLVVCADGSGPFTSIREAIRRAAPGTRIEVGPGLYQETLLIDKPLEIVGRGAVEDIVVEPHSGSCLTMHTSHATVRGLTLRGGPQGEKTAHHVVDVPRGRLKLEDCRILSGARSCLAVHGAGAEAIVRRCSIEHGKESGVLLSETSQCLLEDCEIKGNAVGVTIRRYACPTIRHCRIHLSAAHGIDAEDYAEGTIEGSEIVENGHAGVCIGYGSMLAIRSCRINGNERAIVVASNGGGDVRDCNLGSNALGAWSIITGGEAWLRRSGNWD